MDSTVTVIATATAVATSTPIDIGGAVGNIGSIIGGVGKFLSAGPVGWGIMGGVLILLGIMYFFFKAKINAWLADMAKKASDAAAQKAREEAAAEAARQEAEMAELQKKLDKFEAGEKKNMLDALTLDELKNYAVEAYGQPALDAILAQSTNDLQVRYNIYVLYGLKITA